MYCLEQLLSNFLHVTNKVTIFERDTHVFASIIMTFATDSEGKPPFWGTYTVAQFKGKRGT